MSWLKKALQRISRKPTYQKVDLTDLAVSVVQSGILPQRLEEQERPFQSGDPFATLNYANPLDAFVELRQIVMDLDRTVRVSAFPFGRAMDNQAFARVLRGYETIMAWTNWILGVCERLLTDEGKKEKTPLEVEAEFRLTEELNEKMPWEIAGVNPLISLSFLDKAELVRKLEWFIKCVPYRAQRIILNRTWSKEDVTGKITGIFQTYPYSQIPPTTFTVPKQLIEIDQPPQDWGKPKYYTKQDTEGKEDESA